MRGFRIPHYLVSAFAVALGLTGAPAMAAVTAHPKHSAAAETSSAQNAIVMAIADEADGSLKRFYRARGFRPLWVRGTTIGPQATTLIGYLASARLDGLKPSSYDPDKLAEAVAKARSGDPRAVAQAELKLSTAFARYASDQRRPGNVDITYADRKLKPKRLKPEDILRAASFPKSFETYVSNMDWMSAEYVRLRQLTARAVQQGLPRETLSRLALNMDRARILPSPWTRHVVVDASSGVLWYYEAGKQVGTMRVVVGAQATQTPMLVGSLQWAIINPYWNVPTYLARGSIAQKVMSGRSLAVMHIEALTGWDASARPLAPSAINWPAVVAGDQTIRLRQLPGPFNSMGKVKFLFPNDDGIYLHDTPERELLAKDDRHFSNGCIRLEKAEVLGKWLLEKPVGTAGGKPEQPVPLPVSVPVYLTYITAMATKSGVAFRNDIYGRDKES